LRCRLQQQRLWCLHLRSRRFFRSHNEFILPKDNIMADVTTLADRQNEAKKQLEDIIASLNKLEEFAKAGNMYKTKQRITKLIYHCVVAHTDLYGI
jgi:hypothetical protein